MKQLIPMDDYGIFCDVKETMRVDSRFVAIEFEKRHADVIRAIENLTADDSGLSNEFVKRNFALISYADNSNRKYPCYALTRDGFTMLVMGFTGQRAMQFKEAYIKRFNEMECTIKALVAARMEFPLLTANIALIHDQPRSHHFSNECDMINKLAIGMTAKQFRELHGIAKGESIRPYLTQDRIELIETLQKLDAGLLISTPDYAQRKRMLEWFISKRAAA